MVMKVRKGNKGQETVLTTPNIHASPLTYSKEIKIKIDHRPLESMFSKYIGLIPTRLQKLLLKIQYAPKVC